MTKATTPVVASATPAEDSDATAPGSPGLVTSSRHPADSASGHLVTVPDVVGLPYELAERRLQARGLRAEFREVHETGPEGVLWREPAAARLPAGTTITLVFADSTDPGDGEENTSDAPVTARTTVTSAPSTKVDVQVEDSASAPSTTSEPRQSSSVTTRRTAADPAPPTPAPPDGVDH